ncbi:MAG: SMP-30/gluconolactonase/LRE family protein [Nitrospirae bacterium]|nr:SMP-30/gluconolactonase/LRE family protein [Nitrospirota bacterium]
MSVESGKISTLAGTGEPGHAGDRGAAVAARLNEPKSLALDGAGSLYIADSENHVVRKVDIGTGIITTVAGQPDVAAFQGAQESVGGSRPSDFDEDDPLGSSHAQTPEKFAQLGDLSGTVRFVTGTAVHSRRYQGDGGAAVQATLNFPTAVALDAKGHLYIADTMNHRVRRVDASTGVITTIVGTGQHRYSGDGGPAVSASLNEPSALVVDPQRGCLYIADQSNNRVRKVDQATGIITTVAGTGQAAYTGDGLPATEAALAGPSGLALDPDGRLYIADTFNGRIRMVDMDTGLISTVAGDGGEYRYQGHPNEFSTSLSRPYGIAIDPEGHLLLTDSDSHLIRRWDRRKKIATLVAGNGVAGFGGDGGPARESCLNYPFGVAVDRQGNVYVADTFNHRIRRIAASQP